MSIMTDKDIHNLISCPKIITEPPKQKMTKHHGHLRNSMKLKSQDGSHDFTVFMRINEDFDENFSIGLKYSPKDQKGEINLIRCNGPHGFHISFDHHTEFHIHTASADNIEKGVRPERNAEITKEYVTYQEALSFFIITCNIKEAGQYFQTQLPLFDDRSDQK